MWCNTRCKVRGPARGWSLRARNLGRSPLDGRAIAPSAPGGLEHWPGRQGQCYQFITSKLGAWRWSTLVRLECGNAGGWPAPVTVAQLSRELSRVQQGSRLAGSLDSTTQPCEPPENQKANSRASARRFYLRALNKLVKYTVSCDLLGLLQTPQVNDFCLVDSRVLIAILTG